MIDRLSPQRRNIALTALVLLLLWFCWVVRSVLNPLILGYLLAFILHPLVLKLEARKWSRRKAVNLIFGAFAVLLSLLGLGIFFQAQGLVSEFSSDNGLGHKVEARVDDFLREHNREVQWAVSLMPRRDEPGASAVAPGTTVVPPGSESAGAETEAVPAAELRFGDVWNMARAALVKWLSDDPTEQVSAIGLRAGQTVFLFVKKIFGSVVDVLVLFLLWPIYTYFLLFELERIHRFVTRYLPYQERDRIVRIGTQIGEVLASFFRGRLLVCAAKGACLAFGLWIAGVEYSLLLGIGTGFLSLIPFVGSAIGFTLAFVIALLEHGVGGALLRTGAVFLVAEGLENYILIPKILGDSLGLHPIVVIFAIMAGGASMGMFGLLLALPITASLVILAREFVLPVLAQLADKDRSRPPAKPKPG